MLPNAFLVLLYTSKTCNTSGHNITVSKSLLLVNRTRQTHNEEYGLIERFSTLIKLLYYSTSKSYVTKVLMLVTVLFPPSMGKQLTVLNGKKKAAWLRECFVRGDV
jgi:hypothetical protein